MVLCKIYFAMAAATQAFRVTNSREKEQEDVRHTMLDC